jgi:hypothetical protein
LGSSLRTKKYVDLKTIIFWIEALQRLLDLEAIKAALKLNATS